MFVGYSAGALVSTILVFDKIEMDNIIKITNKILNDYSNRNIGFVFQSSNLLNEFSALENVALSKIIKGFNALFNI